MHNNIKETMADVTALICKRQRFCIVSKHFLLINRENMKHMYEYFIDQIIQT